MVQWPTTYLQRLGRVFAEAYRVSRPNAILAVNVGSRRVAGVYYPLAFYLVPLLLLPGAPPGGSWLEAPVDEEDGRNPLPSGKP